jgi:hypothetical protein
VKKVHLFTEDRRMKCGVGLPKDPTTRYGSVFPHEVTCLRCRKQAKLDHFAPWFLGVTNAERAAGDYLNNHTAPRYLVSAMQAYAENTYGKTWTVSQPTEEETLFIDSPGCVLCPDRKVKVVIPGKYTVETLLCNVPELIRNLEDIPDSWFKRFPGSKTTTVRIPGLYLLTVIPVEDIPALLGGLRLRAVEAHQMLTEGFTSLDSVPRVDIGEKNRRAYATPQGNA